MVFFIVTKSHDSPLVEFKINCMIYCFKFIYFFLVMDSISQHKNESPTTGFFQLCFDIGTKKRQEFHLWSWPGRHLHSLLDGLGKNFFFVFNRRILPSDAHLKPKWFSLSPSFSEFNTDSISISIHVHLLNNSNGKGSDDWVKCDRLRG
jgi:hypothetical protein